MPELLALAKTRTSAGDIRVYDHFQESVNKYVRCMVNGSAEDRKDVVQDIFEAIFRGIHTVKDPDKFDRWVFKIMKRMVCREWRKRQKRNWLGLLPGRETEMPEPAHDPAHSYEQHFLFKRALDAVAQLPFRESEVFRLRWIAEESWDEVARLTGYAPASAKRYLKDAEERLIKRDPIFAPLKHARARAAGPRPQLGFLHAREDEEG